MMRKQYTSVFKAKVVQERLHQALDYQTPAEVYFSVPPSVSCLCDVHEERESVLAPDMTEPTREQASAERRRL